jgi:hypothetical protein
MTDLRTKIIEFVAELRAEAADSVGPDTIINVEVKFAAPAEDKDRLMEFAGVIQAALNETQNQAPKGKKDA